MRFQPVAEDPCGVEREKSAPRQKLLKNDCACLSGVARRLRILMYSFVHGGCDSPHPWGSPLRGQLPAVQNRSKNDFVAAVRLALPALATCLKQLLSGALRTVFSNPEMILKIKKVDLKRRLDLEGTVRRRLPRLAATVQAELNRTTD